MQYNKQCRKEASVIDKLKEIADLITAIISLAASIIALRTAIKAKGDK